MSLIEAPEPQARQLLGLIVAAFKRGVVQVGKPQSFPTYSQVLGWLGRPSPSFYSGSRLRKLGLDTLNDWTLRHAELPKITALIVNKTTCLPGRGFVESHGWHEDDPGWKDWWLKEADKAIGYDWTPFLPSVAGAEAGSLDQNHFFVREDESEYDYGNVIVADPPPATIRKTGTTVAEVLQWLAAGESEKEIIHQHPELRREDIRASLAFAADQMAVLNSPNFTARWTGKFALPAPDAEDARLSYLLARYEERVK